MTTHINPHPIEDEELGSGPTLLEKSDEASDTPKHKAVPFTHSWSLWCIFSVLCLFSFLTAVDGTILTTSLPTITHTIGGGNESLYIWYAQCFLFANTAPQPLVGQISNIFGRRQPFLVSIAMFALGSGIAGGANTPAMFIAGRTIQGVGSAGLFVLSDILICDLVPPRHRGPYLSAVLSTAGIGSTIGPVIGGALVEHSWRWIFYLNIPISVLGFLIVFCLLKVNHNRPPSWTHAMLHVDYLGALIFIPSTTSLFYALITGGNQHPWSSWRVILPLILGIVGWALYHIQQATPSICRSPSTPSHLFTNRTSATGYALIFLTSIVLYIVSYFLPFYFQALKLVSPLLSGVYYLPFALAIIPFAGLSGWVLSKWGKYVPLHYAGTALIAVGVGLFATLDADSSRGAWIGFQILPAAGIAMLFTATMPSVLAALHERDVAVATATYSFIRSFGMVWGITIAGIMFNGQVNTNLGLVHDVGLRDKLGNGAAYAFAAREGGLKELRDPSSVAQVMHVYTRALRSLWLMAMAVALLALVCVPIERSLKLGKEHTTDFGMIDGKEGKKENKGDDVKG
ncbi:MFS general substrate transporter [Ophiobolus disseminans]|uniref:MFS general substrate transporter n=1 Tax=Ophiobolus disseminans TaxID=1469910 RepID=A0A6A6ZDR6_9PLEO|nr:MFS general substrate transporter [Ophiobolus disseminans]